MEIRPAEAADSERIRAIASDSFQSSYALSPQQIEAVLEAEFTASRVAERLDDDDHRLYIAEDSIEGQQAVSGFLHATDGGPWTIRWLHVDPEARGMGAGTALFEELLSETAAPEEIRAWVFEEAVEGGEFCEQFGLNRTGNEWMEFGGERFAVGEFSASDETSTPNEPNVEVPSSVAVGGVERPLDRTEPVPGQEAPFFHIYTTAGTEETYGYFCSQCGSTDVSADGLDRLECGHCGNHHRADEWDDAYL